MPSRKNERHLSNLKTRRPGTPVRVQTVTVTSPVSEGKLRVDEQGEQMLKCRCGVCMEVIQDGEPSEESLLCEGPCKKWVHRTCADISESEFLEMTTDDKQWFCSTCEKISTLQYTVSLLESKVLALESVILTCRCYETSQKVETVQNDICSLSEQITSLRKGNTYTVSSTSCNSEQAKVQDNQRVQDDILTMTCDNDTMSGLELKIPNSCGTGREAENPKDLLSDYGFQKRQETTYSQSLTSFTPKAKLPRSRSADQALANIPLINRFQILETLDTEEAPTKQPVPQVMIPQQQERESSPSSPYAVHTHSKLYSPSHSIPNLMPPRTRSAELLSVPTNSLMSKLQIVEISDSRSDNTTSNPRNERELAIHCSLVQQSHFSQPTVKYIWGTKNSTTADQVATAISTMQIPKQNFLVEKRKTYNRGKKLWYFALLASSQTITTIVNQWNRLKQPWTIRSPPEQNQKSQRSFLGKRTHSQLPP